MIDRNDQGQPQAENSADIDVRGDTAVRLLRNFVDADFRNYIPSLMENAPHAVQTINEDYQGTGKDKLVHTQQTLQLLDTNGLSEADRFVARTSMMFHDCSPGKAIADLSKWVKSGFVTNSEAVDIIQQVWWHDLLGVDVNKGLRHTAELSLVIQDEKKRMINLRVFQADTESYGLGSIYKELTEQVPNLKDFQPSNIDLEKAKTEGITNLPSPNESDIFVHGIYVRGNQSNLGDTTSKILMNMLVSDNIRSTGLLTNLETFKVSPDPLGGKATDNELNMFRFQPGNYPSEVSQFGQSEQNWLKIVFLGRDIQADCVVKPLTLAEQTSYVAGIVNRFDENGMPKGAELGMDKAYFLIAPEAAQALIPILKLEAIRLNQDPEKWIMERVVIDRHDNPGEILSQLATGELNVREHNIQSLLETLNYSGFTYSGLLRDSFDSVTVDGVEERHNGFSDTQPLSCRVIDSMNMSIGGVEERLRDLIVAIPELATTEKVLSLKFQIEQDKSLREKIITNVRDGSGEFFDELTHTLYLEGQSYGGIVVVGDVLNYKSQVENADSNFSREAQWDIELSNDKSLVIRKGMFQYD